MSSDRRHVEFVTGQVINHEYEANASRNDAMMIIVSGLISILRPKRFTCK